MAHNGRSCVRAAVRAAACVHNGDFYIKTLQDKEEIKKKTKSHLALSDLCAQYVHMLQNATSRNDSSL